MLDRPVPAPSSAPYPPRPARQRRGATPKSADLPAPRFSLWGVHPFGWHNAADHLFRLHHQRWEAEHGFDLDKLGPDDAPFGWSELMAAYRKGVERIANATPPITADQALDQFVAEGFDRADVGAAIGSLIDAGLNAEQTDDSANLIDETDMQVLRDQLNSSR